MKKALITGVTGQDGSYLAELLLDKEYEVYGLLRRSSVVNTERIAHLLLPSDRNAHFHPVYGDMTDSMNLARLIGELEPDEIYNLAAQSHVAVSFEEPEYTANADGVGTLRVLEAVRIAGLTNRCRIYQASTSELFGRVEEIPQRETTPFHPRSPYAVAKMYAYWITRHYREAYGMFAANGILFNHESERRGANFVTRKITLAAARIALGQQEKLSLGNLSSKRDWGYAKDYVDCMWRILQQPVADDFVIATGETRTVREFCTCAFRRAGIELEWNGAEMNEVGVNTATGKVVVDVNPAFFRPAEVDLLLGDPTKAREVLGWNPRQTSFDQLVEKMVDHDLELVRSGRAPLSFD